VSVRIGRTGRPAPHRIFVDAHLLEAPAIRIKLPKVSIRPTMPLTCEEMVKILAACADIEATMSVEGKLNALRLKSLIVLMRYSGMRVSDAVTLTTDRIDGKKLFLYTQKTGVPVYTVLPDSVLSALEATPRVTGERYFWSGQSKRESIAGLWEKRLKKAFERAGISKGQGNAVSHRFRDTFAVELLLAGVPIERVSILLGHQSVRITEKHYNPWVRPRQEQLESDVARAWKLDPVLKQKNFGTNRVHSEKGPVN
jgi:integrase/recombinase XerD